MYRNFGGEKFTKLYYMTFKKKKVLDTFFEIFHNKRHFLNIRSSQNMKPL